MGCFDGLVTVYYACIICTVLFSADNCIQSAIVIAILFDKKKFTRENGRSNPISLVNQIASPDLRRDRNDRAPGLFDSGL
jgi:hypothetical protein